MRMCVLLKYPWTPGPWKHKENTKQRECGGLQATLNVLLDNWLTMPKPALDFMVQETVRCLTTDETCWEATVQVEVGFQVGSWLRAVVPHGAGYKGADGNQGQGSSNILQPR